MRPLCTSLFARIPFWVLIAAWFCANTPQTATWHALLWAKDARHFSHQSVLQTQVAAALAGHPTPDASPTWSETDADSRPAHTPSHPADATIKKILLSLETDDTLSLPNTGSSHRSTTGRLFWISHVADVPHPPPRA